MNNLLWNCMSYSICDNVKRRTYTIKKSAVAVAAADVVCCTIAMRLRIEAPPL